MFLNFTSKWPFTLWPQEEVVCMRVRKWKTAGWGGGGAHSDEPVESSSQKKPQKQIQLLMIWFQCGRHGGAVVSAVACHSQKVVRSIPTRGPVGEGLARYSGLLLLPQPFQTLYPSIRWPRTAGTRPSGPRQHWASRHPLKRLNNHWQIGSAARRRVCVMGRTWAERAVFLLYAGQARTGTSEHDFQRKHSANSR